MMLKIGTAKSLLFTCACMLPLILSNAVAMNEESSSSKRAIRPSLSVSIDSAMMSSSHVVPSHSPESYNDEDLDVPESPYNKQGKLFDSLTEEKKRGWFHQANQGDKKRQAQIIEKFFRGNLGIDFETIEREKWSYVHQNMKHNTECAFFLLHLYSDEEILELFPDYVPIIQTRASEGNKSAQYLLGRLYFHGWCVSQDYNQALKLWENVLDPTHPDTSYLLGLCHYGSTNYEAALPLLTQASIEGHLNAKTQLVRLYLSNNTGLTPKENYINAVNLLRQLALKSRPKAMFALYKLLTDENPEEAIYWLEASARRGYSRAIKEFTPGAKEFFNSTVFPPLEIEDSSVDGLEVGEQGVELEDDRNDPEMEHLLKIFFPEDTPNEAV